MLKEIKKKRKKNAEEEERKKKDVDEWAQVVIPALEAVHTLVDLAEAPEEEALQEVFNVIF